MTTRFYALFPNTEPETIRPEDWTEWRNMDDDRDQSRIMVLRKFIRNRGVAAGLRRVYLYEHDERTPRHETNDAPMCCRSVTYSIGPIEEPTP